MESSTSPWARLRQNKSHCDSCQCYARTDGSQDMDDVQKLRLILRNKVQENLHLLSYLDELEETIAQLRRRLEHFESKSKVNTTSCFQLHKPKSPRRCGNDQSEEYAPRRTSPPRTTSPILSRSASSCTNVRMWRSGITASSTANASRFNPAEPMATTPAAAAREVQSRGTNENRDASNLARFSKVRWNTSKYTADQALTEAVSPSRCLNPLIPSRHRSQSLSRWEVDGSKIARGVLGSRPKTPPCAHRTVTYTAPPIKPFEVQAKEVRNCPQSKRLRSGNELKREKIAYRWKSPPRLNLGSPSTRSPARNDGVQPSLRDTLERAEDCSRSQEHSRALLNERRASWASMSPEEVQTRSCTLHSGRVAPVERERTTATSRVAEVGMPFLQSPPRRSPLRRMQCGKQIREITSPPHHCQSISAQSERGYRYPSHEVPQDGSSNGLSSSLPLTRTHTASNPGVLSSLGVMDPVIPSNALERARTSGCSGMQRSPLRRRNSNSLDDVLEHLRKPICFFAQPTENSPHVSPVRRPCHDRNLLQGETLTHYDALEMSHRSDPPTTECTQKDRGFLGGLHPPTGATVSAFPPLKW